MTVPAVTPAPPAADRRDRSYLVHDALRSSILDGGLGAGTPLSQVELARRFGVSRGPVREALRMLEREGLIEARVNQQVRVAPLSMSAMEQTYAVRILVESLAARVTAPTLTDAELASLADLEARLAAAPPGDWEAWEGLHRRFHDTLTCRAGPQVLAHAHTLQDHSARYRRAHLSSARHAGVVGVRDHHDLVEAATHRDGRTAGRLTAAHLARTALSVMAFTSPGYEPTLLRSAVQVVLGEEPDPAVAAVP